MIGRLRGELVHKQPPFLMIEVNGVGYELEAPMSTFYDLPEQGQQVLLFTHLAIRDDAHILYGFASDSERALFRTLLRISGVGAKMALAILSGMSAEEFARCIQNDDTAALVRLPGIGKKTAERLIVEMRDRLDRLEVAGGPAVLPRASTPAPAETPVSDAVGALVALGYKPNEANRMVRAVASDGLSSEQIIRAALQSVAAR
ncbi:MAG TPA: Holliday junction branch migration protein RuvA [Sedimenticola sp.]|nr:Holliday junction branch migration protein RuvA [Sedimenticola sp.]